MKLRGVTSDEQELLDRLGPSRPIVQCGWFIGSVLVMIACSALWYWIMDQLLFVRVMGY